MSYSATPPAIDFPPDGWEENIDRLYRHIRICGVDMHLEAIPVIEDRAGQQVLDNDEDYAGYLFGLTGAYDPYETIVIGGKAYVLIATPFAT